MAIEKIHTGPVQLPLAETAYQEQSTNIQQLRRGAYEAERRDDCYYADDEKSELDITINDLEESDFTSSEQASSATPAQEQSSAVQGVAMPIGKYYEVRKKMVQAVAAANSRRGFAEKNATDSGYQETVARYKGEAQRVIAGADRKANALQDEMYEYIQGEGLKAAGFAVGAIKRAAIEQTQELQEMFTGPHNTNPRNREYRYLDRKIKEHSS